MNLLNELLCLGHGVVYLKIYCLFYLNLSIMQYLVSQSNCQLDFLLFFDLKVNFKNFRIFLRIYNFIFIFLQFGSKNKLDT